MLPRKNCAAKFRRFVVSFVRHSQSVPGSRTNKILEHFGGKSAIRLPPLAKGANKGQMAQSPTKHRNLQQAILSESAHALLLSMRDRCSLFRGAAPCGPVRSVDHHETQTSSLSVSLGLDIWAGGFVPPVFFTWIMKNRGEPQPSLLFCRRSELTDAPSRTEHHKPPYSSPDPF